MNTKVDWFFDKDTKWKEEYGMLRTLALSTGLTEELKWGCPCYTFKQANIVLIHGFKDYCALLFHKGVLLEDGSNLLIQQTPNVQSARQIRFTNLKEITQLEMTLQAYIYEAIEVEKAGVEVPMKKTSEFDMPEEFKKILKSNSKLKSAFEALTPGRQRGYLLYFAQAKQAKTRELRIEKSIQDIFDGKGINDK